MTLLLAENVKGLEGGVQAVTAQHQIWTCHLDSGLCQCLAQGLLLAQMPELWIEPPRGQGKVWHGMAHMAMPQPQQDPRSKEVLT